MNLHFVTSNANKLRELSQLLHVSISALDIDLPEIQTSNLKELVQHKLISAYEQVQKPLIVEDTSLYFNAWNDLPGPLIKWFLKNMELEGMVQAINAFEDHSARAVCCLAFTEDGENFHLFEGEVAGKIVSPRGSRNFGWDAIFEPDGYQKTFGELSTEEKSEISPRGRAAGKFRHFLEQAEAQK